MAASTGEASPLLGIHTCPPFENEDHPCRKLSNVTFRIVAAMLSFAIIGLFNSSIGAVLPLISRYYSLTDLHVSLIFVAGPAGYILAAQSSNYIHDHFGQRGVAFLGSLFLVVAAGLLAAHSHFGVLLVGFTIQGLGTGLLDGSWCAWAGTMERANTISGLLHGSYSAGAAAGPFIVTVLTTRLLPWYEWYSVLAGASVLSMIILCSAFRHESALIYHQNKQMPHIDNAIDAKATFRHRATWLCAAYFLTYVGVETAISGWVVTFMLRSRNATPYIAGLTSSGFFTGMALGRLGLGPVTDRIGVRPATVLYFLCAVMIEIAFAVNRAPIVAVVLMTLLGFIMGPLFPSGVIVLTQALPKELHIAAVSFVASVGQFGGGLLPFGIGALMEGLGVEVFQYAVLLQSTAALILWCFFARLPVEPHLATAVARGETGGANDLTSDVES